MYCCVLGARACRSAMRSLRHLVHDMFRFTSLEIAGHHFPGIWESVWIMQRNIRSGQVQAQIGRQTLNHFHRPLHTLMGACFAAGLALDGLEEPAFTTFSTDLAPRWDNCGEIPPVLAARLRVPGA